MTTPITAKMLEAHEACTKETVRFAAAFPNGASTKRDLKKALRLNFDLFWAANNLLERPHRKLYEETRAAAWKLYDETRAAAWKLYDETCSPARKLYDETRAAAWKLYYETFAPAWKLYYETFAPARKLYDETCAAAWKLYDETRAAAFFEAWKIQCEAKE